MCLDMIPDSLKSDANTFWIFNFQYGSILIQDAFFSARQTDLQRIAGERLDPAKIQITVVGDKFMPLIQGDGSKLTLESALQSLAGDLGIPYKELPLR